MLRYHSRALSAGLVAALAAALGAVGFVARAGGFGAGDLRAFTLWCVPLAVLVALLATIMRRRRLPSQRLPRVILAAAVGLLGGALYSIAVATGMGPWIAAFSFPVLTLWAAGAAIGLAYSMWPTEVPAVTRSPRGIVRMLLGAGVLLLAVAILPAAMLLGSAILWDRAEHEVHLIPSGFRGPVVIVFGQSGATPPEHEGRARLYRIPSDGVLRTQFRPNEGWGAPDYFYVDAAGRRSPIARGARCADSLPNDPVRACLMARVFMSGRTGPEYTAYVVGHRAQRDALYRLGDSLVQAVVFADSRAPAP